jgi:uncharacterized protein (DUF1778 family)
MRHATATVRRSRKEARLQTRVTPEQKRLIARAAALRGFSVTEFVVASAQQAASEAIKEFEFLTLHDHARNVFVNAVLHELPDVERRLFLSMGTVEELFR